MNKTDLISEIENRVKEVFNHLIRVVPVGVSNRHVHLSQEDLEILFGKGAKLTKFKSLKQPNQYAAEECITLEGRKGQLKKVRILGPVRTKTQIEISIADGFKVGITPPVRPSGSLADTPGIKLIGPKGSVELSSGVIAAHRHIHMNEMDAKQLDVVDGEKVSIRSNGLRATIFENVTCRVNKNYVLELHLDMDEANAAGVKNNDLFEVMR